ncbi:hypothetical protein I5677_04655 [Mobilitalea sibirica]|uniref:Uncharacterized protein n=1 Tax=Mobilitalea sibirica TaxID=1462919 RepID=A0A8J7H1P5_9FIRM|nr:DUF6796 family protein [Mobilitalea sibirica]MBH1940185.1 hypothetical protein [Mobilitalea sibirica]
MNCRTSRTDFVIVLGLIGILGMLITIISDFILLAKPTDAYTFFKMGTETMADISSWRITVGTFLGVIVLPIQILGLIPLYYALKPAGKVQSRIVFFISAHALMMGVGFHTAYAYMGSGWRLYHNVVTDKDLVLDLMHRYDFYWRIIIIIMMSELIVSSILYVIILLKGKSMFPKWMALLNPVFIMALVLPLIAVLPAPVGGYVAPAVLNISTLVFVSIIMIQYKRKKV